MGNEIHGGVFFGTVIQGRQITIQLPREIRPALGGLPPRAPSFSGRSCELATLCGCLRPGSVTVTCGLAGIGKTELAVQAAWRVWKDESLFPGGVLFVDMFGYDDQRRLTPERALDGLVRALGVPPEHVPVGDQQLLRLYRSALDGYAEQGKPILVVIDNASSEEQVQPLLPADGGSAALVTSRHTLALGTRLDLGPLDAAASVELIRAVLRDGRVQREPGPAARIAESCGGLPLALQIAAALLADFPTRPLASYAEALHEAGGRLNALEREERAVRAAFALSFQRLAAEHARIFLLLALIPGPDFSTESTCRLAGTDADSALQALGRAHLIEPGTAWGRWRLHDLVRLYAAELVRAADDQDEFVAAQTRLIEHFGHTAGAADALLRGSTDATSESGTPADGSIARFADRAQALDWLDAEYAGLRDAVRVARLGGHLGTAVVLPLHLNEYLLLRRHLADCLALSDSAVSVARELGYREVLSPALNALGRGLLAARRFDDAIEVCSEAAGISREIGDRQGEALALDHIGMALRYQYRFAEAVAVHQRTAELLRGLGDQRNAASALNNLGIALRHLGRVVEALDACLAAFTAYNAIGDRTGQAQALNNFGTALNAANRLTDAVAIHRRAAELFEETDDTHGIAEALGNLGGALLRLGQRTTVAEAHTVLLRAAEGFEKTGDQHGEAMARHNLGLTLEFLGRAKEARVIHLEAAALFLGTGDTAQESRSRRLAARAARHSRWRWPGPLRPGTGGWSLYD